MFGPKKMPEIPGFVPVNDQILVRHVPGTDPIPEEHPSAVLIYGWGDCRPKHVAKFCDGFQHLYPRSKQVVILASISKTIFHGPSTRAKHMMPVLEALGDWIIMPGEESKVNSQATATSEKTYGLGGSTNDSSPETLAEQSAGSKATIAAPSSTPTILVLALSSTGMCNHAATISAYELLHSRPFPHQLLIADSTPGRPELNHRNIKVWSKAMTVGTAKYLPWPAVFTHFLWYLLLWVHVCFMLIVGQEGVGMFTVTAIDNEKLQTKSAKRLFLYSREDDLIPFEDIEELSEETQRKGYDTRREVFRNSRHVRHMQKHPEQYWKAIDNAWTWALYEKPTMKVEEPVAEVV